MTTSFIVRQMDTVYEIQESTGQYPLIGIINEVLMDAYDHDELLAKGQGMVSIQRRIERAIRGCFNNVLVPNKHINKENNWSRSVYVIINQSDIDAVRDMATDLL